MAGKDLNEVFKGFSSNQDEFEFSNVMDEVANSFEDLIDKLQKNIVKAGHADDDKHSTLLQSVVALPKFLGSRVVVEVRFEEHGLAVDKGTRPEGFNRENLKRMQPKIMDWINRRPKLQRVAMEMARRKGISDLSQAKKSLSYAIATNVLKRGTIKRFGYKGSNWFSKEVVGGGKVWEQQLKKKIAKALGMDCIVAFKIIAEDFKK